MNKRSNFLRVGLESTLSILPIVVCIIVLSLTGVSPLKKWDYILLGISAVILIAGMSIFNIGSYKSLVKVGEHMGASLSKQNNLFIVVIVAVLLGALVTCAEPSIMLLSEQTPMPAWLLILAISLGAGIFIALGIIRVIFHRSLKTWLIGLYGLIFAMMLLVKNDSFLPLIFDSSSATTGAATVPFLLSLGAGVATVRGGRNAKNDSFGLIAVASIGPLFTLTLLAIFSSAGLTDYSGMTVTMNDANIWNKYLREMLPTITESGKISSYGTLIQVAMALIPILIIFYIYQAAYIKLPRRELSRIAFGFLYTYIGLVLFLTATQATMLPIGEYIGTSLGTKGPRIITIVCFVIGFVEIFCEPAIAVLTRQIEDISDGGISRKSVLITLSVGVGIAVALSGIRAYFGFSILYYVVPGYIIALALTYVTPPLYSAIAFDSGCVSTGPMTTSFILPMIIGITTTLPGVLSSDVVGRSFGVVGTITMTSLIAIEVLGFVEKIRVKNTAKHFYQNPFPEDDSEVIHFGA